MYVLHGLLVPAPGTPLTHGAIDRAESTIGFWAVRARRLAALVGAAIHRALIAWRDARRVRATRAALASLDAATLRDLGLYETVEALREHDRHYATRLF